VHLLATQPEILDPASPDMRVYAIDSKIAASPPAVLISALAARLTKAAPAFKLLNAGARRHIPAQSEACVTAVEI